MTSVKKAASLAEVTWGGSTYVLALRHLESQQTPIVLEGSGHLIWGQIDGSRTVKDIAQALSTGDASLDAQITTDVSLFVETLRQRGLLE